VLREGNVYPEGSSRELRELIGRTYGVGADAIIFGNGADEIIYYLAMSLINDGDEVIIPRLTFPIYEIACRMMRAEIIYSEMDGFRIDLDDILHRVTGKTKLITLCNPNNPTGHALSADLVYPFIEAVPGEVILVMDEAYADFADGTTFPESVGRFKRGCDNLVVIRTLSKAYGLAGFRVGYGIGDPGIVELMNRIKLPFNVSLVSQHAALGALGDDEFLEATVENTKRGREEIHRAVERLGLSPVESSTNFILIDTHEDADQVTEELMKRGVIVRSAKNYGTPTSIRVTVGTREQNRRFIEAMEEMFQPPPEP
jgi:histidinol-phosphate aminotransferase